MDIWFDHLSYKKGSLYKDYLISFIGGGTFLFLIFLCQPPYVVRMICEILLALFVVFGLSTLVRHGASYTVTSEGIWYRCFFIKRYIGWDNISKISFSYLSSRKKKGEGVYLFVLRQGRRTIKIDSDLEHFKEVVTLYHKMTKDKIIPMSLVSVSNLHTYLQQ